MEIGNITELDLITVPLDGEVVFVEDDHHEDVDLYAVRVFLTGGSEILLRNVPVASLFGDPQNTSRIRLRPMFVKGEQEKYILDENTIGERVIVQFLGGNRHRPIITGRIPHIASKSPFYDYELKRQKNNDGTPQVFFSCQGFDFTLNDKGDIHIKRRGKPERVGGGLSKSIKEDELVEIKIEGKYFMAKTQLSKIEVRDGKFEISTPTFKLMDDNLNTLIDLLKNFTLAGFHPALGPVQLGVPYIKKLQELQMKIQGAVLK